jgi:hypothetical protein
MHGLEGIKLIWHGNSSASVLGSPQTIDVCFVLVTYSYAQPILVATAEISRRQQILNFVGTYSSVYVCLVLTSTAVA